MAYLYVCIWLNTLSKISGIIRADLKARDRRIVQGIKFVMTGFIFKEE